MFNKRPLVLGSTWPAPAGKIHEKLQCIWLSMCGVSSHNKARIFFCWRPWAAFSILFTISSYVSIMIIVMLIKAGFCSQLECSSVVVLLAEGTLKIFLVISSGEAGRTGVVSCWVKVSVYFLKGQLNIFLDSIDLQCNLRSQYLQASFLYPPAKGTWARDLRISKKHKKVGLKHLSLEIYKILKSCIIK